MLGMACPSIKMRCRVSLYNLLTLELHPFPHRTPTHRYASTQAPLPPPPSNAMVLSVRQKVRRRWLAFVEYITPDYWDLDPVHVAHRSLAAARERALQEEQTGQQQEEKFVRGSTCTADGEDGGEGGDGSCDKDVEAGVADEERASQEKQQQQVVLVRGRRSQMYTPHRANPLTLVAPYYGSMEGGTPEQERRNKSYDNLCTRIFLVMDEPNWK